MLHETVCRDDDSTAADPTSRPRRILVADDDAEMRALLLLALRAEGYEVTECRDGDQFVDRLFVPNSPVEFDLIISDVRMPGHSGLDILDAGRLLEGFPPMILITAFGSERLHEKARRLGALAVFDKPFDIDDLIGMVAETLLQEPRRELPSVDPLR